MTTNWHAQRQKEERSIFICIYICFKKLVSLEHLQLCRLLLALAVPLLCLLLLILRKK